MFLFDAQAYGPGCEPFLRGERLSALGPGTPDPQLRSRLSALRLEDLFAGRPIRDRAMAQACLAGLWLLHDCLEESHRISQRLDSPTGSYWHGIMHRREPDASNAKYWFRRVGTHPVHRPLSATARELAAEHPEAPGAAAFAAQSDWDPARFVDLCAQATRERPADEPLCRRVARAEWELLFDHCYRRSLGNPR